MAINKTQVKEKLADINIILTLKSYPEKGGAFSRYFTRFGHDLVAAKSPSQPIFLPVVC